MVEVEEFGEEVVFGAEVVGFEDEAVKLAVELGELAGGFVEEGVVEFGDAPLFGFHLLTAVFVQFEGFGSDGFDFCFGWVLRKGEGFKASFVRVSNI